MTINSLYNLIGQWHVEQKHHLPHMTYLYLFYIFIQSIIICCTNLYKQNFTLQSNIYGNILCCF